MTPTDIIRRGEDADVVLNSKAFTDAVVSVRTGIFERWVAERDERERTKLWERFHLVEDLVSTLRAYIGDAKAAARRMEDG